MSLTIKGPGGGPDVTRRNKQSILYLVGDAFTNGSIRFMFTPGDTFSHFELMTDGVWNDTGLRVSPSSMEIGRDLTLSTAGGFLDTFSISAPAGHQRAIIPHNEFDEKGTRTGHMPVINAVDVFVIFDTPVSQTTGTSIGQIFEVAQSLLLNFGLFQTGTVPATSEVTLSIYRGTDNSGALFFQENFNPSVFPANSLINIAFKDDVGLPEKITILDDFFIEFTSDNNFSLKTDVSSNIVMTFIAQEIIEQDILTDNFILSEDLDLLFTENLDFIVGNPFP